MLILTLLTACAEDSQNSPSGAVSENAGNNQSGQSQKNLVLPYTQNDVLNPYTAKSKNNQELGRLLYDPILEVDASFNIKYRLAKDITHNGNSCIITLDSAYFSDGTPVTAGDVVYSVNQIKANPECEYYGRVSVIQACTVQSEKAVKFTLTKNCELFLYYLDFPIIKTDTAQRKNSDNRVIPPVGSGRYLFNSDSGRYSLSANQSWIGGNVNVKTIELVVLPDQTAVDHALQVGGIDIYYSDLKDNVFPSMTGGASKYVMRNNLVYLGVGQNSSVMRNKYLRYAVSFALDRESIAKNAYFGLAVAATGPYHADFGPAKGLQIISTAQIKESAIANIALSGYNTKEGGYYLKGSSPLTVKIIYNSENTARASVANQAASNLESVGIKTQVEGLSYNDYTAAVKGGYCDLYVAEMRIGETFDLYPVFTAGGNISFSQGQLSEDSSVSGVSSSEPSASSQAEASLPAEGADTAFGSGAANQKTALQSAYAFFLGTGTMSEMLSCFNNDMPFIPVCHHSAICVYSSGITGDFSPAENDPYYGIENIVIS